MERWFISPAMHQVHHGRTRSFQNSNYGTWLAVWDVIGGTWRSGTEAPEHFGLEPADRNHAPDDLVGALWRPVVDAGRHLTRSRLAPLSLLLLSPRGEAQDTVDASDDEEEAAYEVVVETTVEGIPRVAGSAHVVGQDELERFEQDDVHRILSRVPGVYLRDEDGFGLRPNIGLRGANSDRSGKVTLMEDGVLVAPAAYSAPAAYYFPMVTRMVGVEVFKGPSSIQFGPQTIGGAINLVTRAVPDGIRGEVDMSIGQRNAMKLHGWFGVGDASGGLLLEAVRLAHGGFKTVAVPPGTPEVPTGFERHEFMAKALWKPVAEHQLSMKMAYSDEESFETYLGLSPVDFETDPYQRYAASAQDYMAWRRAMAQLAYDGAWSSAVQWRSVAYMSNLRRAWTKVNRMGVATPLADILRGDPDGQVGYYQAILAGRAESAGPEDQVWIGTNDRTYWTFGTQHGLSYRRQGDTWASRTDLGVRLHFDSIARLHDEAPWAMDGGLPRPTDGAEIITSDQTASALAFSAYVREDAQFGMLRLLPGIRVEAVETVIDDRLLGEERQAFRAVPLPGLGVHLQPLTTLSVFGGLHRGFSPVSPTSPADTLPELSWNTELGTRWTPNRSRLELVGFFNAYENLTGQCTFAGGCSDQQLDQQFNAGNVWVWGLEALASHEVPIRGDMSLQLSGNYTWTGSRFLSAFRSAYPQFGDVEVGDRLPYVPEHQGMAQLVFLHPKFNLSLAATGRSFMRDEASQGAPDATASVPGSLVLDAAAHAILSPNVRAYVTAQNLTNQSWAASLRPFGVRPVMPLQVMFGLKVGADPQ
ncbi:MAG: TonB-dependent receptor domain-containing protein, partial [Myxococcota bacterium]